MNEVQFPPLQFDAAVDGMVVAPVCWHQISHNIHVIQAGQQVERHLDSQTAEKRRELTGGLDWNDEISAPVKQSERRQSGGKEPNHVNGFTDAAATLRLTIVPPAPAVSPAQFILADLLQHMRGWVVWEVLHSVHGFVHGWDVFHRPLLFVLVMVQDVVDATQPCPRTKSMYIWMDIFWCCDGELHSDPYQWLLSQTQPPFAAHQPPWKAPLSHQWETARSKRINGHLPNGQSALFYPVKDNEQDTGHFNVRRWRRKYSDLVAVQSESGLKFPYFVKVELRSALTCPDQAIGDILDHP